MIANTNSAMRTIGERYRPNMNCIFFLTNFSRRSEMLWGGLPGDKEV
jgi:hypothetical protein